MAYTYQTHTTLVEYDVIDEAPMDSLLGPDDMMVPHAAQLEYRNGEFVEVIIWGRRVSKTGRPINSVAKVTLRPEDLVEQKATEDFEPYDVPEWVKQVVISATFGGRV